MIRFDENCNKKGENRMQMPGFTAEAALYPSGYRYEAAGALGDPSTTAEVVPKA